MIPFLLRWTEETISQTVPLVKCISFPSNHIIDSFTVKLSKPVPLYSATLHLVAHFTGLQHWMYHWFVTSFVVGTFVIWTIFEIGLLIGMMFETRRMDEDDLGDDVDSIEAGDAVDEKHGLADGRDRASDDEHDRLVPMTNI